MEQEKTFSVVEYLNLEIESLERNEYRNGKIVEMESSSFAHAILGAQILFLLHPKGNNSDEDYWLLGSQIKVFIEKANYFVYSSAVMISEEIKIHELTDHAITNPTLIVEVLSDGTEAYDRGQKFHLYSSIPSLKEYILIDQTQPIVDVFFREKPTMWKMRTTIGLDKSFPIHTLGFDIKMADLYKKVPDLQNPPINFDL